MTRINSANIPVGNSSSQEPPKLKGADECSPHWAAPPSNSSVLPWRTHTLDDQLATSATDDTNRAWMREAKVFVK